MYERAKTWFYGHRWLVLIVSLVAGLGLVAVMQALADGVNIIAVERSGSVTHAAAALDGSDGLGVERGLYVDFVYILAYGASFLAAVWLGRGVGGERWNAFGRVVMIGVFGAMACDVVENKLLLWALPLDPSASDGLWLAASIFANAKFALLGVAFGYTVISAGWWVRDRVGGRHDG